MNNYAKENLSTEQSPPRQEARLSRQNGDQKRTRRLKRRRAKGRKVLTVKHY